MNHDVKKYKVYKPAYYKHKDCGIRSPVFICAENKEDYLVKTIDLDDMLIINKKDKRLVVYK